LNFFGDYTNYQITKLPNHQTTKLPNYLTMLAPKKIRKMYDRKQGSAKKPSQGSAKLEVKTSQYHGHLSEEEALAWALEESKREQEEHKGLVTPPTTPEETDQLARAIEESKKTSPKYLQGRTALEVITEHTKITPATSEEEYEHIQAALALSETETKKHRSNRSESDVDEHIMISSWTSEKSDIAQAMKVSKSFRDTHPYEVKEELNMGIVDEKSGKEEYYRLIAERGNLRDLRIELIQLKCFGSVSDFVRGWIVARIGEIDIQVDKINEKLDKF
jgi:hypothetical protein